MFKPRITFLARRGDGLGERLRALVNAMVLARATGQEFRFHWPNYLVDDPMHAMEPVGAIFAKDFVKRYHVEDGLEGFDSLVLGPEPIDLMRPLGGVGRGWNVQQTELRRFTFKDVTIEAQQLRDAFYAIEFVPPIRELIGRARKLEMPENAAAVHFRCGDVVFGAYRFGGIMTAKSLSFPVVKNAIEKLLSRGKHPVLFCPDRDAAAYLKQLYPISLADDLLAPAGLTANQLAFRDIVLMSRCRPIVAVQSGFAVLASWIGKRKVTKGYDLVGARNVGHLVREDLIERGNEAVYPPLHAAFAYLSALRLKSARLDEAMRTEFLERAAVLDPKNWFYPYELALSALTASDWAAGSRRLENLLESRPDVFAQQRYVSPRADHLLLGLPTLAAAAAAGSAVAEKFRFWVEGQGPIAPGSVAHDGEGHAYLDENNFEEGDEVDVAPG